MNYGLSEIENVKRDKFEKYLDNALSSKVDDFEREQSIPRDLIQQLCKDGLLNCLVPSEYGGSAHDSLTLGLICEEIGKQSASLLSILIVHNMACYAISKWGTHEQKEKWLPKMATGEVIGALALTEPNIGSDAQNIELMIERQEGMFLLNGAKKWISCAQIADIFVTVGQLERATTALIVERKSKGMNILPITGMLGFRAAMLAEIQFNEYLIDEGAILGRAGFGFSHVVGSALDLGRFCVAAGCCGLARACTEQALEYSNSRKQFGELIRGHQLIQQMTAKMLVGVRAARALWLQAAKIRDAGEPQSILETSIAKYFASKMVNEVAADAIQIYGAAGCHASSQVERYYRDAKIMEIIEGSSQIQEIIISKSAYQELIQRNRERRRMSKNLSEPALAVS
jgi:glutaryl-CoA dehydrogenase (non-decarboxylating)